MNKRFVIASLGLAMIAAANFTRPPFGTSSETNREMWQAYSSLVERCVSQCETFTNEPSSSMNNLRYGQYKAKIKAMVDGGYWINPTNIPERWTSTNLLANVGYPTNWFDVTYSSGMSDSTNGLGGWTNICAKLTISAVEGSVEADCGGTTNAYLSWTNEIVLGCLSRSYCSVESNEYGLHMHMTNEAAAWPIGEARRWDATNVTYIVRVTSDSWYAFPIIPTPCPTNYPPSNPPWIFYFTGAVETNYYCNTIPASEWLCAGTESFTAGHVQYDVIGTVTDLCATNYICAPPTLKLWNHAAAVDFTVCTNMTCDAEVWAAACAPTNCFPTDFNAADTGLTNGWGKSSSITITTNTVCYTNFARYRVPWKGDSTTNAYGYAITNALIVQKWNFEYR